MVIRKHIAFPLLLMLVSSIAMVFLYSLFFEGETLISSPRGPWIDTGPPIWINWATAEIIHRGLQDGFLPLWSGETGIGVPLLADPHLSFLSPFSFILYLFPNSYGWDAMVLLKAGLTLLFARAFLVRLGQNAWFAAWGAVLYTFSGHIYQFLHHFHTNSLVFAPLCLIALVDVLEQRYRRGIVLFGLALPLMVFGGGLLDIILMSLLFILISIFYLFSGNLLRLRIRFTSVVAAVVIVCIAFAIAAVWLLPYLELRAHAIPPRPNRAAAIYDDWWYLFGLFIKNSMAQQNDYSFWLMKWPQYMSILALPGFLLGVYALITSRTRYQYVYIGILLFTLLQTFKVYGLPWLQVVTEIPILEDVRYEKYIGLATFGFYAVSAYGYQRIFLSTLRFAFPAFVIACLGAALLISGYGLAHRLDWDANMTRYALLALYPLLAWLVWRSRFANQRLIVVTTVVVSSLIVLYQINLDTSTRFDKRLELFQRDNVVAAAQQESRNQRFLVLENGPRIWSAEGLNDVRDISVVHTTRYYSFFKKVIEEHHRCWHKFVLCASDTGKVSLAGLRWLGVDTLLLKQPQLDALQTNPDQQWEHKGRHGEFHIVGLHNVPPIASVTSEVRRLDNPPTIQQLKHSVYSGNDAVFLEGERSTPIEPGSPVRKWTIESMNEDHGNYRITVNSDAPGYLMIKHQYYPGWRATLTNNQGSESEVPVYRANSLFQAIPIPAGTSIVALAYQPQSVFWGVLISLFSIFVLAGVYYLISWRRVRLLRI